MTYALESTKEIPREHIDLWFELFRDTNGRVLRNPLVMKETVIVTYGFEGAGEANRFEESFISLVAPVKEVRRSRWGHIKAMVNRIFGKLF